MKSWPNIKEIKYKSGKIAWMVDLRGLNGERKFYEKKKEAEKFAEEKRKERDRQGVVLASIPEQDKTAALNAVKRSRDLGFSIETAVEHYIHTFKPIQSKQIQEIVEELILSKSSLGRRPRYVYQLEKFLNRFSNYFNNKYLKDISCKDIEEWFDTQEWSNRTRKNAMIDLTTLYSYSIKKGYATENPIAKMDVPLPEETEIGILTVEETKRLLEGLKGNKWLGYVCVSAFAGLRSSEALNLDWSQIDLIGGFITVTGAKAKSRQRRHVRIEKNLLAWLHEIPVKSGPLCSGKLFPSRLAKIAGLDRWKENSLRHSFASRHLALYRDANKTAHELGHYNQSMLYNHYAQLTTEKEAKEYFSIYP